MWPNLYSNRASFLPDTLWSKLFLLFVTFLHISYTQSTLECIVQGKGGNITGKMIFLAPHGPFYQFSDHGWNKPRGMAKREALFALSRLPQLLLRVLLAAVPTSDSAYTSCHAGLLQALIGTGFMCLVCACKMQQPGPCRSSGAIAKGAAVWFTDKGQEGKNGYSIG